MMRDINDQAWRADLLGDVLRSYGDWGLGARQPDPAEPDARVEVDGEPPRGRAEFVRRLEAKGVPTTVRDTRGPEIDGACGQLAARTPEAVAPLGRLPGRGYYDREAPRYDETRGGVMRARAAAEAVGRLSEPPGRCLDVGGGTGIVSAELARAGWSVSVLDLSAGMLGHAAGRLPGRVARASATALPVADRTADLVVCLWLLHLLGRRDVAAAVGEAARVLRPGGTFCTTVDKQSAHGRGPLRATDSRAAVDRLAAAHGLVPAGGTTFSGPSAWGSVGPGDPVFTLVAYRRR